MDVISLLSVRRHVIGNVTHDTADAAGLVVSRTLSLLGALGLLARTAFVVVTVVVTGVAGWGGWWVGWLLSGRLITFTTVVTTIVVDGTSGTSKLGNWWTREHVIELGVKGVDEDALVIIRVSSWESDELVGGRTASFITGNFKLSARRIELGTLELVGEVQGDKLVHNEVVARGKVVRDLGRAGLADESIPSLSPFAVLKTVLANLEPLGLGVVKLGAIAVAVSHVSEFASGVVWPLLTRCSYPVETK